MSRIIIQSHVLGDVFFKDHARLGRFVNLWDFAIRRNDPKYWAYPEDDNETTLRLALATRWIIEGRRGQYDLTGPDRKPMWLRKREPKVKTYIIEAVGSGLVKIGKSKDPQARLAQLQTSNASELRMLAVIQADVEATLHSRHNDHRVSGEWFRWSPTIQMSIDGFSELEG